MCGLRGGQTQGHVRQLIAISFAIFYWKCARNVFQVLSLELQTKITGCHTHTHTHTRRIKIHPKASTGKHLFWPRVLDARRKYGGRIYTQPESVAGRWLSINLRGSWRKTERVLVGEVRGPMLGTGTSCVRLLIIFPLPFTSSSSNVVPCAIRFCVQNLQSLPYCHNSYFSITEERNPTRCHLLF